jgi:hypothetical protein
VDLAARRLQAGHQRVFDRGGVAAEIVPGHHLLDAEFRYQAPSPMPSA